MSAFWLMGWLLYRSIISGERYMGVVLRLIWVGEGRENERERERTWLLTVMCPTFTRYYQGRIREEGMQLTISPTCEQKPYSIYL